MNKIGSDPDSIIAALEAANREKDDVIAHVIKKGAKREKELLQYIKLLNSTLYERRAL